MRRGRSTMLLLGGVLALLAFFVLYIGLSAAGNSNAPVAVTPTVEPKAQVVVAATDIPAFTVLSEEMLTIKEVALSTVVSNSVASTIDLVGRMTTRQYPQDAQIRSTDVQDPGISQILETGQRAYMLPIQEANNFGGQLVAGDSIDVLWTREFATTQTVVGPDGNPVSREATLGSTKTILQNVKILRMVPLRAGTETQSTGGTVNADPSMDSSAAGAEAENQAAIDAAMQAYYNDTFNGQAEPVYTGVAILSVTNQQAEVIKYMREYGRFSLALRAKDDAAEEVTTGITDKIMVEDYGLVAPELIVK